MISNPQMLALVFLVTLLSTPASSAAPDETVVTTSFGTLVGTKEDTNTTRGVAVFRGIPYAEPPIGARRWRAPVDWTRSYPNNFRPATAFSGTCVQPSGGESGDWVGSEDCLYLNIWRPVVTNSTATPLPVLFFIHGGSCTFGAGSLLGYDGARLASEQGVIVVTINYRLGPFGFLVLPGQLAAGETGANFGLLDQRSAMRWVNREIANFGGDPHRVTLFGESAGSLSVCMHLLMPQSYEHGLFHGAIMESRTCSALALPAASSPSSLVAVQHLANASGCLQRRPGSAAELLSEVDAVACLRDLPALTVGAASASTGTAWLAVADGMEVPDTVGALLQANSSRFARVPIITGTNANEGATFVTDPLPDGIPVPAVVYEAFILCPDEPDLPPGIKNIVCWLESEGIHLTAAQRRDVLDLYPPLYGGGKGGGEETQSPSALLWPDNTVNLQDMNTDKIFLCPSLALARVFDAAGVPVNQYLFNQSKNGAPVYHAAELPFVFGNFPQGPTEDEAALSKDMMGLWADFARDLAVPAATWPMYSNATGAKSVVLDAAGGSGNGSSTPFRVLSHRRARQCAFWEKVCGSIFDDGCNEAVKASLARFAQWWRAQGDGNALSGGAGPLVG